MSTDDTQETRAIQGNVCRHGSLRRQCEPCDLEAELAHARRDLALARRLHDLRRSFVTLARRRGVPEAVTMAKSGHKDPKVFKRYNIVEDIDLTASREIMERGRAAELAALAEKRRGAQRSPNRDVSLLNTCPTPS